MIHSLIRCRLCGHIFTCGEVHVSRIIMSIIEDRFRITSIRCKYEFLNDELKMIYF